MHRISTVRDEVADVLLFRGELGDGEAWTELLARCDLWAEHGDLLTLGALVMTPSEPGAAQRRTPDIERMPEDVRTDYCLLRQRLERLLIIKLLIGTWTGLWAAGVLFVAYGPALVRHLRGRNDDPRSPRPRHIAVDVVSERSDIPTWIKREEVDLSSWRRASVTPVHA